MPATPRRLGACVIAISALLAGCATGPRPSFAEAPVVDDAAAAVVIERLDRAGSVNFTATYEITPTSATRATPAIVRQLDGRGRVTIGDVDYLTDGTSTETCRRSAGDCVEYIDDTRISDLNITNRFWSDGFSTRLAIDAARRVGFSEGRTETIADRPAVCATVPVLGGDKLYCALDDGVLARYIGPDVTVQLVSFSNDVDPASFATEVDPGI
ncbi:MAG: hypothetical protein ABIP17_00080 [Ilumatobacteraceae bacterium]